MFVGEFNQRFAELSPEQRGERYQRLAEAALRHYALDHLTPVFIRHNGGVTYRLDDPAGRPHALLKIGQPAGENGATPPRRLSLVLEWLAALARESPIAVQEPIRNAQGEWLTAVEVDDLSEPFHCAVQHWISGDHVRGAFTPLQAYRVGAMIGRLHEHSSRWTAHEPRAGMEQDESWLAHHLSKLSGVISLQILDAAEWRVVEAAADRIAEIMRALGRASDRWGSVHGDLHHENLLFHGEQVSPIDFGDLRLAHFPYDLGVLLYHLMYLDDAAVRRAVADGYRSVRHLPDDVPLWPEGFLCAGALSNLSFQTTIPRERSSALFARNVREFADVFCRRLVNGDQFVLV
jgi:Ser/Thr protein kinase RdoA (MazF antagonist)